MDKQAIWFASSNIGKINEIKLLFNDYEIKLLNELPYYIEPEETGLTFKANALIKAESLSKVVNEWVISDDSGICVESLNGFPGVHSKRWIYPETSDDKFCELLLKKMDEEPNLTNRNAYFETCLVLHNSKLQKTYFFSGICKGKIGHELKRSKFTFAYDMIFIPDEFGIYYAELDGEIKRKSSARGIAVKKLVDFMSGDEFKNVIKTS